jgi:hypothetical protein
MPQALQINLTPEQQRELAHERDYAAKAYVPNEQRRF